MAAPRRRRDRLAVALIALGTAAVLGHAVHLSTSGRGPQPSAFQGGAGPWTLRGAVTPAGQASVVVEVQITVADGLRVEHAGPLALRASMPLHPMVPVESRFAPLGGGRYRATATLAMPGRWRLAVVTPHGAVTADVDAVGVIDRPNPMPASPESLAAGERIYRRECEACHGIAGAGDGPAAGPLQPRPADLRVHVAAGHSDGVFFYFVSEGVRGTAMPGFKDRLSESERWHVVNFIRTLALTDR